MAETVAMGDTNPNQNTAITINFQVFIFASIAVFIVGLLIGTIEIIYLQDFFTKKGLSKKILYKLLLYTSFLLLMIFILFPIAAMLESDSGIFDPYVWQKFGNFLYSMVFLNTMIQMMFSLLISLIYSEVNENLGHGVLFNFFTGKYHSPKEENRIFMFLDMKSSTTIAESLGHIRYFDLLREYYADMSESIINTHGEVYQYIGDEIVITWRYDKGIKNNNCIKCFFLLQEKFHQKAGWYHDQFGVVPSFKAGIHAGVVTTGEIGALKKEIIFTGDVLNTTARIQSLCNSFNTDLIISDDLLAGLDTTSEFEVHLLGSRNLKGRAGDIILHTVEENEKRMKLTN